MNRCTIQLKCKAKCLRKKGPATDNLTNVRVALSVAIAEAKIFYFSSTLPNFIKEDPQKFCNFIKEQNQSITNIIHDSIPITDPNAVANLLNDHFHSVFSPPTEPSFQTSLSCSSDVNISHQGVLNMLLRLKVKSSVGPNCIPNTFLRRYAEPLF